MAAFALRERRARLDETSEPNVIPFIDVLLVLLVIFMVTAPTPTTDLRLDLPPAAPPAAMMIRRPSSISALRAMAAIRCSSLTRRPVWPRSAKMRSRIFCRTIPSSRTKTFSSTPASTSAQTWPCDIAMSSASSSACRISAIRKSPCWRSGLISSGSKRRRPCKRLA